jgi:hypothetical protein
MKSDWQNVPFMLAPLTSSLCARYHFELTPRITAPLENLTVARLLKKSHTIYVTQRLIAEFTTTWHRSLSWAR